MFFISKIFGYRSFIEQINGVDLVYEYRLDKRHNLTPKTQISLFKWQSLSFTDINFSPGVGL